MASGLSATTLLRNVEQVLGTSMKAVPDETVLTQPANGISLLDVKNDIFLAYLQTLTTYIILLLRAEASTAATDNSWERAETAAAEKLAELRTYLGRGVRPLENRLKYQIDKVVRAANAPVSRAIREKLGPGGKSSTVNPSDEASSDEGAQSGSGQEHEEEDVEDSENELAYRPNPAAFVRPQRQAPTSTKTERPKTGVYKPPKITPTSMPTTADMNGPSDRYRREKRGPGRSTAVDDFIASEMSGAPAAEPSIGSTIAQGGRRTKSAKERQDEAERRAYEESNFVRLPSQSKKERAKNGPRDRGWGGEELRGITGDIGRIDRLTSKGGASKRRATEDGPRGEGYDSRGGKRRRR